MLGVKGFRGLGFRGGFGLLGLDLRFWIVGLEFVVGV